MRGPRRAGRVRCSAMSGGQRRERGLLVERGLCGVFGGMMIIVFWCRCQGGGRSAVFWNRVAGAVRERYQGGGCVRVGWWSKVSIRLARVWTMIDRDGKVRRAGVLASGKRGRRAPAASRARATGGAAVTASGGQGTQGAAKGSPGAVEAAKGARRVKRGTGTRPAGSAPRGGRARGPRARHRATGAQGSQAPSSPLSPLLWLSPTAHSARGLGRPWRRARASTNDMSSSVPPARRGQGRAGRAAKRGFSSVRQLSPSASSVESCLARTSVRCNEAGESINTRSGLSIFRMGFSDGVWGIGRARSVGANKGEPPPSLPLPAGPPPLLRSWFHHQIPHSVSPPPPSPSPQDSHLTRPDPHPLVSLASKRSRRARGARNLPHRLSFCAQPIAPIVPAQSTRRARSAADGARRRGGERRTRRAAGRRRAPRGGPLCCRRRRLPPAHRRRPADGRRRRRRRRRRSAATSAAQPGPARSAPARAQEAAAAAT